MKIKLITISAVLAFLVSSCSSLPTKIGADLGRPYKVIGKGSAQVTGIMLFGFIPIGQNTKFSRAYDSSLVTLKGDALTNISVTESWFYAYVLNGYKTKIEGDVIRYTDNKSRN